MKDFFGTLHLFLLYIQRAGPWSIRWSGYFWRQAKFNWSWRGVEWWHRY